MEDKESEVCFVFHSMQGVGIVRLERGAMSTMCKMLKEKKKMGGDVNTK